jgi:hypothetical protein
MFFVGTLRIVATSATAAAFYPDAVRRPFLVTASQPFWAYGTFIIPAVLFKLPACSTGVLALATACVGVLAEATISAANLAIATSSFGAISLTTTADGVLALITIDRGTLEGCDD